MVSIVRDDLIANNCRMSQIAATEDQMRAEGKIDKEGHLNKNGKPKKKKKQTE